MRWDEMKRKKKWNEKKGWDEKEREGESVGWRGTKWNYNMIQTVWLNLECDRTDSFRKERKGAKRNKEEQVNPSQIDFQYSF